MPVKIAKTTSHICLFIVGLFIVITLFPHETPWRPSNLHHISVDDAFQFRVSLPMISTSFTIAPGILITLVILTGAVTFFVFAGGFINRAWRSLREQRTAFYVGIAALVFLVITLIPPETETVREGSLVVSYLVVNTFGLFLVVIGLSPFVASPIGHQWAKRIGGQVYDALRYCFLRSPRSVFVGTLAVIHFSLANVFSFMLFEHIPHIQDSIAQVFHGIIFTKGMLTAPAPQYPEFFEFLHVIIGDGKWYSQYPPGHSVLMMVGVVLDAPWIINPLVGSLTLIAIYALAKELHGEIVGRFSALLFLLSPFVMFMSSEFMNHTSALFFFILFLHQCARSLKCGTFMHGAFAGAAFGWLIAVRPYSAAALGTPFLVYGVIEVARRFDELKRSVAGFSLILAMFLTTLFAFNWLTNGHPLLFGYQALWGNDIGPGFGLTGWGRFHTPLRGLLQTLSNLNGMNKYLFELPVPSLLLVSIVFFTGTRNHWDYLFVTSLIALGGAFAFYWYQDWCFGPRFLFESAGPLIILAARGLDRLPTLWNDILGYSTSVRTIRQVTCATMIGLFTIGFATNIPPLVKTYGDAYWGVNRDVVQAVGEKGISHAVVFVESDFGGVYTFNDPLLLGDIVYARDLGARNHLLMSLFPGYKSYKANGSIIEPFVLE